MAPPAGLHCLYMDSLRNFIAGVLGTLVRLTLWLFTALLALLLLAVALVLLFFGVLWALVRGKRPVQPVFVGRFRQYASQKVWPGGSRGASAESAEVVDIEVREVREGSVVVIDAAPATFGD